jgi:hypothetical protein
MVVELTTTESVVPLGPEIVSTSPLIVVTLPAIPAGTMSIRLAIVASAALTAMCTLSPVAMSAATALCPFLVTVVEALMAYVEVVPARSVTVMDVAVMAETSPPMPQGTPGAMGIDDEWFRFAFAVTDVAARGVAPWVEALATPTPVATTPMAMAEVMLACWRVLLRITLLTDGNLLSVSIGGNLRRRYLRRRACGDDWDGLRTK